MFDGDAVCDCFAALALDLLAVARIQRAEEIVEGRVALVFPVELLVGSLQEAVLGQQFPFVLACEGDMDG